MQRMGYYYIEKDRTIESNITVNAVIMRRAIFFLFFYFLFSFHPIFWDQDRDRLQHWPQLPDSPTIDLLGYYCRCPYMEAHPAIETA